MSVTYQASYSVLILGRKRPTLRVNSSVEFVDGCRALVRDSLSLCDRLT